MKKLTLIFLTLLIVMPSLVCSMTLCPMASAQATETSGKVMPCHEQSQTGDEGGVMLTTDCMGVDLQKADTVQISIPDFTSHFIIYSFFADTLTSPLTFVSSHIIRGSPSQPDIFAISSSVYQNTQRFRL